MNVQRAAWVMIRRYGKRAAEEALRRIDYCESDGRPVAADVWRCVCWKIAELHRERGDAPLH